MEHGAGSGNKTRVGRGLPRLGTGRAGILTPSPSQGEGRGLNPPSRFVLRAPRSSRSSSAFILIQALLTITGLVALMAMLAADQHVRMVQVKNNLRQRRAEVAADAAVARTMAVLVTANPNNVTLNDDWVLLGANGDEAFDLGDSTFRMQILDDGAQVNINTAATGAGQQLQKLPLSQEQIDCLLDWTSTGETARSDGAKDQYYNSLPQPYNAELGPLQTVDELLLVKNWTAQTLYQPITDVSTTNGTLPTDTAGNALPLASMLTVDSGAPNTQAGGNPRINLTGVAQLGQFQINLNQQQRQAVGNGRFTSFQNVFTRLAAAGVNVGRNQTRRLLDTATFSNANQRLTGKLNLNTAPASVLNTLPTMTQDVAASIVSQQTQGFTSLSALATVPGLNNQRVRQLADSFAIGSDTWTVRAYGESGGIGVAEEVTVRITAGQARVVTWNRVNSVGVPSWWMWQEKAQSTVAPDSTT